MKASRVLIRTMDNVQQHYDVESSIKTLNLHSCVLDPISAVFNGNVWKSTGNLIDYKGRAYIRFGNRDDFIETQYNVYRNLTLYDNLKSNARKSIISEFQKSLIYYKSDLTDIMIMEGFSHNKSKALIHELIRIADDNYIFQNHDGILGHVESINSLILKNQSSIYIGNVNTSLAHIAIQNIINNILYKNSLECVSALFISDEEEWK